MANDRIGIFVATTTGYAEIAAEEIAAALARLGMHATVQLMEVADAATVPSLGTIVIVSSTYGHGDIPDNGQAFFDALSSGPSLHGKQFAVYALGDRTFFDTFCHAGEAWDSLLETKGACRIAPLHRHDASGGTLAEDEAAVWAEGWARAAASVA